MRLVILLSMFSIFSCKENSSDKWLQDTKFYIQDEVDLEKEEALKAREVLKNYINTKFNVDPKRPRITSTAFYFVKKHPMNKYGGRRMVILTNFVNERSRKQEFDNLELYDFILKNISNMNRGIGGSQKDFQNENYELLYKDFYVRLPVDSAWLIEDPAKISLFHNDYEVKEKVAISGFDKEGEPEIRVMMDGSLFLVFNFMPPSNSVKENGDLKEFDGFDEYLEEKLDVSVQWTDRETFFIQKPHSDTVEKLKYILENYWNEN